MTRKSAAVAMPWVLSLGVALTLAEGEPSAPHRQKIAALRELAGQEQFVTSASNEIVFPQVADGVDEGVGITTAIFLTNAEADELSATLRFRRSDGLGMVVELYRLGTDESGLGRAIRFQLPSPPLNRSFWRPAVPEISRWVGRACRLPPASGSEEEPSTVSWIPIHRQNQRHRRR